MITFTSLTAQICMAHETIAEGLDFFANYILSNGEKIRSLVFYRLYPPCPPLTEPGFDDARSFLRISREANATAKDNYPRINANKARIDIAKNNVTKEQLSWLDAFSVTYLYAPDNTQNIGNPFIFNGYQASVSVNLGSLIQKPGNVKHAKLEQKIAQYDQQEYNLSIESEVKQRYFAYLQQANALKLQSKLVADMQNMGREMKSRYEKSEISFELFSQSQTTLTAALQNKIVIESNFLSAKALLEELLTKKIEEIL